MTTANKITILRILLIPFFVLQVFYYINTGEEWHRFLSLLAFLLAALSDGVDGYIARKYNQRSDLGAVLDPLADKLLLVSGIVLLSLDNEPYLDRLPIWLPTVIISRDLLLLIGLVVIHYTSGKIQVQPHFIGKTATVLQMICVIWILFRWDSGWLNAWVWLAGITTIISAVIYIREGIRQISVTPSSAPTVDQGKKARP